MMQGEYSAMQTATDSESRNPHQQERILFSGAAPQEAHTALILIHGRGASATDILGLAREADVSGVWAIAPQAANSTWYPNRFNTPVAGNEPWLTWALARVDEMVALARAEGFADDRIILAGFSQGACLALEWLARTGISIGGVLGFSGGMIENGDRPREYESDLTGSHVFLGCSDVDFHIPLARVERSAELLGALGAEVEKRIYPGMGHTINQDEIDHLRKLMTLP
jgi:predicted esterase